MTPLIETFRAWSRVSDHVVSSMVQANRATAAAMRPVEWSNGEYRDVESVEHRRPGWEFERSVDDVEAIDVGDVITFTKTVTDDDVRQFADASGDTNRLHLDDSFAEETRFGGRIAHGTLVGGLISAALARLPGLTIYLSQDLEFVAPVEIGDEVTATVEIVEALGDDRYRLETRVERGDELVVDGEAVVMVDALPETDDR
ncbi:MaoC family dehydratase [Halovivax sp.]|uniref:MaoC family dehydratase n=1 Tax=Halovivax sp. TaxID=1935978 RepID=UPI0025C45EB9|nr:MaoC family dehydratase [Halovivax sp.]